MATLTADDMQTWHVEYREGLPPESIWAVYPARDESLPGLISLKDWQHRIVAVVPDDAAALVRRCTGAEECPSCGGTSRPPAAAWGRGARIHGSTRAITDLPGWLSGVTELECSWSEVALRTRALAALMEARADDTGGDLTDFWVHLDAEAAARARATLDIAYEDGDRFGPRLHVMLTGYSGPRKIDLDEALAPEAASALAAAQ